MQQFRTIISDYLNKIHIPAIRWTDIVEIMIIAFLVYHIMLWIKSTRAWSLVRGMVVILVFVVFAALFNMTTILWIVQNVANVAIIAFVIILQPELRHALEEFGQRDFLRPFLGNLIGMQERQEGRFSDKTVHEIVRACEEMAEARTGALIVIRQETMLREFERTGIELDALVTSQLLVNIFEKNTPLHDGAVIISGDRVTAATCYLPLSESRLDKDLGTRHRAGVGISETTDALTLIVSEETGQISIAYRGSLDRNVTEEQLRRRLTELQQKDAVQEQAVRRVLFPRKERSGE